MVECPDAIHGFHVFPEVAKSGKLVEEMESGSPRIIGLLITKPVAYTLELFRYAILFPTKFV